MRPVEFAHPWYRTRMSIPTEARAAGRFTAAEVSELMQRTGVRDLRTLGCPEFLFVRMLEQKAKAINFRSAPEPAPASDLADRLNAVSLF